MSVKSILVVITMVWISSITAQSELGSYFIKNTSANQYLNPANNPQATFSWGLPNIYYVHGSEGPGLTNLIKDNVLNLSSLDNEFKKQNSTLYGIQGSLGGLFFHFEPIYFHIGHHIKSYNQGDYNNLLFDVILNGNAPYIGETINLGPYVNLNFYNEFYLGVGIDIENFSIGARLKRLNGYSNFYTPKHDFSIYTHDEIYQLTFNTAYHINTNLLSDSLRFESYFDQLSGNLTNNGGWAFDFGIKADVLDKFTVSASLLDMGTINWQNGTRRIVTEGNYSFEGFDLNDLITDSLDVISLDSLGNLVNISDTYDSYNAGLPVQFYVGFQYYPLEEWEFNALYYNVFSSGRSFPAVRLGAKFKPTEKFHASLAYSWNRFAAVNLGLTAEAHLGWFHGFLMMDNIFDLFRPLGGNYYNFRAGIQIDFVRE